MLCKTCTLVSIFGNFQQYTAKRIIFDFDGSLKYDVQNSTK